MLAPSQEKSGDSKDNFNEELGQGFFLSFSKVLYENSVERL